MIFAILFKGNKNRILLYNHQLVLIEMKIAIIIFLESHAGEKAAVIANCHGVVIHAAGLPHEYQIYLVSTRHI